MDENLEASGGEGELPDEAGGAIQPPEGTAITIERFPDGITIQVPPAGLWRGSSGLFAFSLIWLGICVPLSLCIVGSIFSGQGNAQGNTDNLWALPLLFSLFWLVGIGMLLAAINMGRRSAVLAVTGGSLMVLQTGLLGSKQREWAPGDVEAVCTGPSGMTVNDKPVLQLQIVDGGAARFGLLTGRNEGELKWMAAELRAALQAPPRPQ